VLRYRDEKPASQQPLAVLVPEAIVARRSITARLSGRARYMAPPNNVFDRRPRQRGHSSPDFPVEKHVAGTVALSRGFWKLLRRRMDVARAVRKTCGLEYDVRAYHSGGPIWHALISLRLPPLILVARRACARF